MKRHGLLAGTLQNALGGSGRLLLGFLLAVLLGRLLGQEGFGIYMVAVAVAGVLEAVAEAGPRTATVRFVAHHLERGDPDRARGVLRTALALTTLVGAILVLAGILTTDAGVRHFLSTTGAQAPAIWRLAVLSSLPLALTAVYLAATRGTGWMTPSNLTDGLAVPLLRITIFLPLFWAGLEELAALWAYLGAALVGLWLAWWFARRALSGSGPGGWEWRDVVPFSAAQGGSGVLDVTLFWADTLIIAALLSEAEVGIYGAAVRLALVPTLFLTAFNTSFQPLAAGLWSSGHRDALEVLYRRVTRLVTGISLPFYVLLAAFAAPFLSIFGPEFRAGATVLAILAAGQIVNVVTGPAGNLLAMAGFPIWNFWNNAALLVLNVAANFLLIPVLGIEGAAWAWAGSLLAVNVARVIEARVLTGLLPFDGRLAMVLGLGAAGVVLLGLTGPTQVDGLWEALGRALVFGVLWLTALAAVLPSEDRAMIVGLVRAERQT